MYYFSAHTQRLLKLQSILRRAPSYRTLELQLIEWQERELFEYFVVVSLKKKPTKNSYSPEVTYQFPKVKAATGSCCWSPLTTFTWGVARTQRVQIALKQSKQAKKLKKKSSLSCQWP